jgi:hypothetical protein
MIRQISVFLENTKGRLADVTRTLATGGVNIRAMSLADTSDFGILRLIVSDPALGRKVLKDKGFMVQETEVLAIEVDDKPGGLATVLEVLDAESVNVEYMYSMIEKRRDCAVVVFRVDDTARTVTVLEKKGIGLAGEDVLTRV